MNARSLARALGGDAINAHQVVCPGPGHSPRDRSLSVFIDPNSLEGFRVHPHAPGDDWRECRDYVRGRLGIARQPHARRDQPSRQRELVEPDDRARTARALAIWQEAQP
jgi:putative DNA primase/helicase